MKLIAIKKHTMIIFICFCVVLLLLPFGYYFMCIKSSTPAGTIDNWGLGFDKSGSVPRGNVSSGELKQNNAFYVDGSGDKKIYLTFDAGYENGFTPAILDVLKKQNVKAAFFIVGNYLKTAPDLVKRMLAEGHIVGNHTYHHPDMSKISDFEAFKKEINELEDIYKSVTGSEIKKYYRPPQGKFCRENLINAKQLGYKTIFWSLAYVDWYLDRQPTREQAFAKLLPRMHPGAIILLHSTSETNAAILDELITKIKSEGYTFASLDELK